MKAKSISVTNIFLTKRIQILILPLITVNNQTPPHIKTDGGQLNLSLHVQCTQGYE
jgi:hypothetical protein